jgi:CubicO group peptidase (beta-lactamase class C family)
MRLWVGIVAVCWLAGAVGGARAAEASLDSLGARLGQIFRDDNIPGAQVAIVEHGKLALLKSYGVSDLRKKAPVTADTVFRAGSISKTLTAIAVMTLVERNKLSLDGRLADLAPEVKFVNPWEKTDPVRLVHLIEHTTGWPDVSIRVLDEDGTGWSVRKGVEFTMSEFVSRWPPGRFTVYNNAGPAVAGLILEKVSGESFSAYVRGHVLRPMGMATADFDLTPGLAKRISRSYAADGTVTPFQNIVLPPAGSLNANARELVQLVRFFLGRGTIDGTRILSPASVDRMERSESNLASKDGFTTAYGLGNAPFPQAGIAFRGHNGQIDSFTAVFGYNRRCDCGYVMMANGGRGVDFATPASRAVEHYLTRGMSLKAPPVIAVPDAALRSYAGFYRANTPPNALLRPLYDVATLAYLSVDHGKVVLTGLGGTREFVAVAPHVFRRTDREDPSMALVEADGQAYDLGSFGALQKEPLWRALVILAVLAAMIAGLVFALAMAIPWLIGGFRGRLKARGGWMVRFAPLLSFAFLFLTFYSTYNVLSLNTSALEMLSRPGPYTIMILVFSLLFPAFAAWGMWLAWRRSDTPAVTRAYAGVACAALLAFSAYAALIGWVGARVWTM